MKRTVVVRNILLTLLIALFCVATFAQPPRRNIRSVLFVHVKPDQEDAWKAAVKDFAALYKQAGVPQPWTIWESQTGRNEYAVVWYSEKWKEAGTDAPELKSFQPQEEAIGKRLNASSTGSEMWIDEIQPDMLIDSGKVPAMVRTARVRVQVGKMDAIKDVFRTQLFPAYKKSGVSDFGVAVARFGTPSSELHSYVALNSWADFDSPFGAEKAMSADEWKSFQEKVSGLIESGTEFTVWKFHPDLSYLPAPTK
jgi:hypothetical protein